MFFKIEYNNIVKRLSRWFILIFFLLFLNPLYSSEINIWGDAGIGMGMPLVLFSGASLNLQVKRMIFTLRNTDGNAFLFFFLPLPFFWSYYYHYEIKETAFLGGLSLIKKEFLRFSLSAGISRCEDIYFKETNGNIIKRKRKFKGFPVEAKLCITPSPILGIGLSYFVNINSVKLFSGLLLCIHAGWLK